MLHMCIQTMAYKHYPAYLFLSYDMCRHPISEATLEITLTRKNREFALTLFFIITAEEKKTLIDTVFFSLAIFYLFLTSSDIP